MDLRYAFRSLRNNPGFTVVAVLVMALGVGANTAVFSVVNAVLLKPLAYRNPDRIVTLEMQWRGEKPMPWVSAPDFHDWHDQATAFESMAYYQKRETSVMAGAAAEYTNVAPVTAEFFGVLGVEPVAGRLFTPEEQAPGSSGAAVISYALWQSRFGGKSEVLGQTVRMYEKTLAIVGILPPGFRFPDQTEIWFPANTIIPEVKSRGGHNYFVVGRLKPGVPLAEAQSQMSVIGTRLSRLYPRTNESGNVAVATMRDSMVRDVRWTLYLLLGTVAVVLLIACANTATLLLAKATSRTREIAIRAAMGAGRWRIVRQLITESLVLALLGGLAGLFLAVWGQAALVALAPSDVPRLDETTLDWRVLAFTLGISVAASLVFGLVPALHVSRVDLNDALKQGGTRGVLGGRGNGLRRALVVSEIALSVILLSGAGLLLKSFAALNAVDLGFHPQNVLVMRTSVPASNLPDDHRATELLRTVLADARTLPGVLAAGATMAIPGRVESDSNYWTDYRPKIEGTSAPQAVINVTAPGAFAALGVPLLRGRDFGDSDAYSAPLTAVINESLARQEFGGADPVGHMISCGYDGIGPMKIVGVVGDVRQYGPARQPHPEIFLPYQQHAGSATNLNVVVRTTLNPLSLSDVLRRKVREHDPEVSVQFTTMELALSENLAAPRFRTLLLAVFAGLAVFLAMAGVYGVLAFVVSQRSSEIGLRMALGARPGNVLRLLLGQGLTLAGIGLALGLAGSVAASRLLTGMLFEVRPSDPATYAGVAVLLGVMALAASYVPARRAAQVDPLTALRQD